MDREFDQSNFRGKNEPLLFGYVPDSNRRGFSLIVHFGCYICLLSIPFPLTRVPIILAPKVYAGGLHYMLLVNFLFLILSNHVFDASAYLPQTEAWAGLSTINFL